MNTAKKKVAKTYGKKNGPSKVGHLFDSPMKAKQMGKMTKFNDDGLEITDDEVKAMVEDVIEKKEEKQENEEKTRVATGYPVTPESTDDQGDNVSVQDRRTTVEAEVDDQGSDKEGNVKNEEKVEEPGATVVIASTPDTLDDITAALDTLNIDNPTSQPASPPRRRKAPSSSEPPVSTRQTRGGRSSKSQFPDSRLEWLTPLLDAYESNGNPRPQIKDWNSVLDPSWSLLKIAESSYAEVYKVTNPWGTSILKVMALKPPSGPGSRRETACTVESVISEVLIMDLMADIPGFLVFRDMHLISSKPPESVVAAWEAHDGGVPLLDKDGEGTGEGEANSTFPHPAKYNKEAVFLVLELGDAGIDVEHFVSKSVAELWDISLGIVLALSTGEGYCGFEHRDLHEGNVCVKMVRPARPLPMNDASVGEVGGSSPDHKFGYSGLEIIILDYTLSRAENIHTNEILAFNLEENQELFYESDMLQHQMYRRMKNWAFFRHQGLNHPLTDDVDTSWDKELEWKDFHPFTNVIWIYYALTFILKEFKGGNKEKAKFEDETKELRERLDPDRKVEDGGFSSAEDIRKYCVGKGWLSAEDTNDVLEDDEESRV